MSNNKKSEILRPASLNTDIHPLIAGRWSSRAIDSSAAVEPEILSRIFEAARWAPSAANNQPWRFLSFGPEDPEALDTARLALDAGNAWALQAPRLLYVLARTTRRGSDKLNARASYETGMAAASMALQAAHEGLVFHQMAGFDKNTVRKQFKVPETFEIMVAVALGRPGLIRGVPEDKRPLETSARSRMALESMVFSNGAVPSK